MDILLLFKYFFDDTMGNLDSSSETMLPLPHSFPTLPTFRHDPADPTCASSWFDQIDIKFKFTSLNDEEKAGHALSALDSATFKKVCRAFLPTKPTAIKDYAKLKDVMIKMFDFTESLFAKRYSRFQIEWKGPEHESVTDLLARIRLNSTYFDMVNFTENELDTMTLLMSMKSIALEPYRIKILNMLNADPKTPLTACGEALSSSIQTQREQFLPVKQPAVNLVRKKKPQRQSWVNNRSNDSCASCGGAHPRSTCKFRNETCRLCKTFGHISTVCKKSKLKAPGPSTSHPHATPRVHSSAKTVGQVTTFSSLRVSSFNTVNLHNRIMVSPSIHGKAVNLQLDTGADVTVLNRHDYAFLGSPTFTGTAFYAQAAGNNQMLIDGSFETDVKVNDESAVLRIYVADTVSSLLGLDIVNTFGLQAVCSTMCSVQMLCSEPHVPPKDIETLLQNFEPLFKEGLGRCTKTKVHLNLKKDAKAVFIPARRLSPHATEIAKAEINALLDKNIIFKVDTSRFATPGTTVDRKDGRKRYVVDFSTGLNNILEDPSYTLPLPDDIFSQLAGSRFFSQLDLSDAYHQFELDDDSKELVTVSTPFGLYRYNRMANGLKTAPAIFQEKMDEMLANQPHAQAYLDDIIVFSATLEEHRVHLNKVLKRIMDWGLRLNAKKCKFFYSSIKFLGKLIDANGIRPDPSKVQAINDMATPTDVSALRAFLGMVNFYQNFIPNLRSIREPLDDLLKADVLWNWTNMHDIAVKNIKQLLSNGCLLTHYDPRLAIVVAADASQNGMGGVISHIYPDGTDRPIHFFSRALNPAQRKYSQSEKEGLALVTAVKLFHRYIDGRRFTLLTDHRALLSIFGKRKSQPTHAANRLHRWALFLSSYDFDIQYRNTLEFGQADALSRLISKTRVDATELFEEEEDLLNDDAFQVNMLRCFNNLPVTSTDIIQSYANDDEAQSILKALDKANHNEQRFYLVNDVIMMNNRVYIPKVLRSRVLEQLHAGHDGIVRTKALARQHVYWPNVTADIEKMVNSCTACIQLSKSPIKTTLASWPKSANPGDRIHIDFAGPILNHMLLVIVDSCSKWVDIGIMKHATTSTTLECLSRYIASNGSPRMLISDNGTQFTSEDFETFCADNGINHVKSAPYHPQSNGQAERLVDVVKRFVKKAALVHGPTMKLQDCIDSFLICYRSTPSAATPGCVSPAKAHIGREIRTNIDMLRPNILNTLGADENMERQFNERYGAKARYFQVDDNVYARKKADTPWFKAHVTATIGSKMYMVLDENGKSHRVHANQLLKRHRSNDFLPPSTSNPQTSTTQPEEPTETSSRQPSTSDSFATPPTTPIPTPNGSPMPPSSQSPPNAEFQPRRSTRISKPVSRLQLTHGTKSYFYE